MKPLFGGAFIITWVLSFEHIEPPQFHTQHRPHVSAIDEDVNLSRATGNSADPRFQRVPMGE